jgi:phosphoglycolate phosphatase
MSRISDESLVQHGGSLNCQSPRTVDIPRTGRTLGAVIRNVIFDWSGTLVDDLPAVWEATNHVFRQAGIPPLSLDQFRSEFQLPFHGFYERYLPGVPMPQLELWFRTRFAECQDSIVPLPHAREMLEFCRAQGLRLFVLTAVHPKAFAVQAETIGFAPFFERIYSGVMDKRTRILELLAENGLERDATVFIGDMQHDIETAKEGGVHSVGVLTGYNSLEHLRQAGPDVIVEHLGELRQILQRQGLRLHPPAEPGQKRHPIPTVGALVFNDDGQMLLVRTNKWSNLWGIPGGKIDWGEASEDALRRELLEETGLQVTEIRFVVVQDAIHPPEFYKDAHFLLLNYTCRAEGSQEVRLNAEAQEFRWVDAAEAWQLPLNTPTRILLEAVVPRPRETTP